MTAGAVALLKKVKSYDNSKYSNYLEKAIDFSKQAHKGQTRESGEPFFSHPLAVANILADMNLDSLTIIGALLHDTVEDTNVSLKKITKIFTPEVAELVDGVTKLTRIEHKSEAVIQAENFRKLIIAISKDLRVLVIKLADRLHNMSTLHHIKSSAKRHKKALETLEIFVPLAERIGMQQIKKELQDLSFQDLYPEVRESITTRLELLKKNDSELPKKIIAELKSLLKNNQLKCEVLGREKTPYSIWDKMKRKNINFEQLSDVMAFRIIVKDVNECYKVLGIIHNNYHAIPGGFKDFISTPKKNGYKSLHTIIIGPEKHKIEVQIRDKLMHEVAALGVAAHWCYKQQHDGIEGLKYNWIQELLQILEVASDSNELLENTKLEMYYDQVFCFTPKGRVIALPKGASAIDFAYAVHSIVGNHCIGTRINKRIAPLRTELQNGDQVEIMTNDDHKPLPSWEKFVVTGKALSEIRKSIRQEKRQEYINLGRVITTQLFEEEEVEFSEEKLQPAIQFFNKSSMDEFFCAVGEGHIMRDTVLKHVISDKKTAKPRNKFPFFSFSQKDNKKSDKKVSIKGLIPGMAVHFASCCHPIPGDSIIGIQQTGKGIAVHVSDCEALQSYATNPEKWLDLAWDKNNSQDVYMASINAVVVNKTGSLATLTLETARHDANINNFKIRSRASDFFEITLDLEVKGLHQLTNIIASLRSKPCVHSVQRYIKQ
jgi:GTP diphosphokinase / guanosine-3',5'-bis(diphosphate) 3'-diphosphatase